MKSNGADKSNELFRNDSNITSGCPTMTTINRRNKLADRLYEYQEWAIDALLSGKHIVVAGTGSGKGAMAVIWAKAMCEKTNKNKVLVVTTASKANMKPNDFEEDADKWCGLSFRESLSSFSVISWHKLSAWVAANWKNLSDWVFVFDEIAKASAGVSSGMGKAFLKIAAQNEDWAGFTVDKVLSVLPSLRASKEQNTVHQQVLRGADI